MAPRQVLTRGTEVDVLRLQPAAHARLAALAALPLDARPREGDSLDFVAATEVECIPAP